MLPQHTYMYAHPHAHKHTHTAPTAPPTAFHLVVLNSTAIEVQWESPPYDHINGVLRGYKLFVQPQGENEIMYNITVSINLLTPKCLKGLTIYLALRDYN